MQPYRAWQRHGRACRQGIGVQKAQEICGVRGKRICSAGRLQEVRQVRDRPEGHQRRTECEKAVIDRPVTCWKRLALSTEK